MTIPKLELSLGSSSQCDPDEREMAHEMAKVYEMASMFTKIEPMQRHCVKKQEPSNPSSTYNRQKQPRDPRPAPAQAREDVIGVVDVVDQSGLEPPREGPRGAPAPGTITPQGRNAFRGGAWKGWGTTRIFLSRNPHSQWPLWNFDRIF